MEKTGKAADMERPKAQGHLISSLVSKERLTEHEAEKLFSIIDRKAFLEELIHILKYRHLLTEDEILELLSVQQGPRKISIPLSVITVPELSALESICRYLKDEKGLRYSEIAKLLNRDQRTIWVTCHNSLKKRKEPLTIEGSPYMLDISLFQDRNLSVLEAAVKYLKDTHNLRYVDIAGLINRDERNVWALYHKAGKKIGA